MFQALGAGCVLQQMDRDAISSPLSSSRLFTSSSFPRPRRPLPPSSLLASASTHRRLPRVSLLRFEFRILFLPSIVGAASLRRSFFGWALRFFRTACNFLPCPLPLPFFAAADFIFLSTSSPSAPGLFAFPQNFISAPPLLFLSPLTFPPLHLPLLLPPLQRALHPLHSSIFYPPVPRLPFSLPALAPSRSAPPPALVYAACAPTARSPAHNPSSRV